MYALGSSAHCIPWMPNGYIWNPMYEVCWSSASFGKPNVFMENPNVCMASQMLGDKVGRGGVCWLGVRPGEVEWRGVV